MNPVRIQRKRVKGWKMPENTVCVTRGTDFGNPFRVGHHYKWGGLRKTGIDALMIYMEAYHWDTGFITIKDNKQAVEWFETYIEKRGESFLAKIKEKLAGKNLACFCKDGEICHADVLLKLANQ